MAGAAPWLCLCLCLHDLAACLAAWLQRVHDGCANHSLSNGHNSEGGLVKEVVNDRLYKHASLVPRKSWLRWSPTTPARPSKDLRWRRYIAAN